jgi:hypothetical protein
MPIGRSRALAAFAFVATAAIFFSPPQAAAERHQTGVRITADGDIAPEFNSLLQRDDLFPESLDAVSGPEAKQRGTAQQSLLEQQKKDEPADEARESARRGFLWNTGVSSSLSVSDIRVCPQGCILPWKGNHEVPFESPSL